MFFILGHILLEHLMQLSNYQDFDVLKTKKEKFFTTGTLLDRFLMIF